MQIFFSVGEPSGDEHAAALITELKKRNSNCECVGFGGPEMQEAGCDLHFELTTMAVMGIVQVLPLFRKFWNLGQRARKYFAEHKPDAVILVDFPGFNWWIARYAKEAGIPVYYYMPPQLWAWASWRVKRVHKFVDHVLSGLNFETDWYQSQGIQAQFVGHPFFEEVAAHPVSEEAKLAIRKGNPIVVGLLPGSRTMEVTKNWPVMLEVIRDVSRHHPHARFVVANYKPSHLEFCQQIWRETAAELPIEFRLGKTSEIIAAADCCLMVSGSVSLEMLARKTPAVVLYKSSWTMGVLARMLVRCRYMTLPNLICGRELMPEFPFYARQQKHVAGMRAILNRWLSDPAELNIARTEMTELANQVARSQASQLTADYVLETLSTPATVAKAA